MIKLNIYIVATTEVVLFKLVFIQTLDDLKSMRKTSEKIKVDLEYRWFLEIPLGGKYTTLFNI